MPTQAAEVEVAVMPILRVADTNRAVAWCERLGLTTGSEHRFGPGMPAFVTVARASVRLLLSEHTGDARPDTLVCLRVRDVDAIAAAPGARDGGAGSRSRWAAHRHATTLVPTSQWMAMAL